MVERNGVRFGIVAFDAIGETPAATATRPGVLRVRMPPRTGPLVRDRPRARDRRSCAVSGDRVRRDPGGAALGHAVHDAPGARPAQRGPGAGRAGADLVVGGHPHWVQGSESVRGALVVYSLGNFVFDMDFSRRTQEGAVLEADLLGRRR